MIAFAGALRLAAGQREADALTVRPRWDMAGLPAA
jgi:N6-L-threonylcarbamoyladenine synthase